MSSICLPWVFILHFKLKIGLWALGNASVWNNQLQNEKSLIWKSFLKWVLGYNLCNIFSCQCGNEKQNFKTYYAKAHMA